MRADGDDRERAAGTQAVGVSPVLGGDIHVGVRQSDDDGLRIGRDHFGRRDRVEQAFGDELVALRVHRPRGDGNGRQDLDGQVELLEVVGD